MALDPVISTVDALSGLATAALAISTAKPCRASGVPYLLAIPVGFGLITVAFSMQVLFSWIGLNFFPLGLPFGVLYLLTQTYGLLFLALAYARRTRLRIIGESTSIGLAAGVVVTIVLLGLTLTSQRLPAGLVPPNAEFFLRAVMSIAALYLVYETSRNLSLTRRAVDGFATIGFALLLVEQIGFILVAQTQGAVASFLAYEGRVLGLIVLNAVLLVGVRKGDFVTPLKRLGLVVPAHKTSVAVQ